MGRIREGEEGSVKDAPSWVKKLYNWWHHLKIPVIKKGPPPKGLVVRGAFNVLFRPGLRKEFLDAYKNFEPEWELPHDFWVLTQEYYHNEIIGLWNLET